MVTEIPDDLSALFHARIERQNDSYVIEVPDSELRAGALEAGETYRIGVMNAPESATSTNRPATAVESASSNDAPTDQPVTEGEELEVVIKDEGEKGDGLARVGPGFVVFVPDTEPGDRVRIEITEVADSYAFGTVIEELVDNPSASQPA